MQLSSVVILGACREPIGPPLSFHPQPENLPPCPELACVAPRAPRGVPACGVSGVSVRSKLTSYPQGGPTGRSAWVAHSHVRCIFPPSWGRTSGRTARAGRAAAGARRARAACGPQSRSARDGWPGHWPGLLPPIFLKIGGRIPPLALYTFSDTG